MTGFIYKIENTITNQCYIGQTIDYNRRKNTHINRLRRNTHDNPKLQNAWIKYGEEAFSFEVWEFSINTLEELDTLECDYIEKYNSLENGYNLVPGGGKPPIHKKVKDDDVISFLCVYYVYGDGYGKTFEEIFGWSKGTASSIKRRLRFIEAIELFDRMSDEEKIERGNRIFREKNLELVALRRQTAQGGCSRAYSLTQEDYNFAFMAKELGYGYTDVANFLGIKPATVKDWFNGRARRKEKEKFDCLSENEKSLLVGRVKTAELSGKPKSRTSN